MKINGHTLEFIKGNAKKIKKNLGIKHSEALEKSAIECGFKSYKDCVNQFKTQE